MKSIAKKTRKISGDKGYRLHAKRIESTGGKAVRTIKYPLVALTQTSEDLLVEEKTFEAIQSDHKTLWGISNFADYKRV